MRCPTLSELPPPPPGKTGWPWTAESAQLPKERSDGLPWPLISVVTPSYNQAPFLEATLRSVLLQGYPNLEYIVVDGGSKDESVDIIRKYEPWLTYWVSEPDEGQYDAINKGFACSGGEIMAWLNSDDMYVMNSLQSVGDNFAVFCDLVQWITGIPAYWDQDDYLRGVRDLPKYQRSLIRLGFYDDRGLGSIQQESTFWSRKLWIQAGGFIDTRMQLAADFDLWRRFAHYTDLYLVTVILAGFRIHNQQKTASQLQQYYEEIDWSLSHIGSIGWLHKLVKNKIGRRVGKLYQVLRRSNKTISYNPRVKRWRIAGGQYDL